MSLEMPTRYRVRNHVAGEVLPTHELDRNIDAIYVAIGFDEPARGQRISGTYVKDFICRSSTVLRMARRGGPPPPTVTPGHIGCLPRPNNSKLGPADWYNLPTNVPNFLKHDGSPTNRVYRVA